MKKGFTLIELLAVILILGIIALIAIPTVNNILKEARRGAFSSTLTNIEKAIENECTLNQIKNYEINYTYTITDGIISPSVEIKGDLPDGTIYVDCECKVNYTLYNNNFSAVKENDEIKIEDKKVYTEEILNGAVPVLSNNLIPVTIDDDGTVRKADIYEKWYSYEEKIWANAVILTEAGKVEDNGIILEDSIESYFVWIPRYKYKLFDMGNYTGASSTIKPETSNAKNIEIIFENKNIEISNGDEVGEYLSHPAFRAFNVNGFWVGKFETTGNMSNITIKPNKKSFRGINVKTMFELSYSYKRNNDSHMMKNTEWGAVAYLSLSKYGINKDVNINNNSEYLTGYSALITTDQSSYPGVFGNSGENNQYNTETGYLASTTGNISGIYDMSGGAYEYMASYRDNGYTLAGFDSNQIATYEKNYFDIYSINTTLSSYGYRILGDATGELGPFYYYNDSDNVGRLHNNWFSDGSAMVSEDLPWVIRSGSFNHGVLGGQLYFSCYTGGAHIDYSFRIILSN